ncbi:hypothetical protein [Pseudarthrobacter sp. C4D7]|uniref:hypothetical protein n=1 Tax=Pseudarthrobacter sp. C4D7 TaxID=2735268 RepID=UPI001584548B|nr:hypothetical protein [Pseudarthrobacter sp. C4D7]NUT72891.1 hypothetical protein [Pseudarthrobacter sp. C4D7]
MKTATSRTMKRRLNAELVSLELEVPAEARVLVGLIIEIRSLLASALTADSAKAPIGGRADSRSHWRPVGGAGRLDAGRYGPEGCFWRPRFPRTANLGEVRSVMINNVRFVQQIVRQPTFNVKSMTRGRRSV